jgi:hypothetical protein
MKNKKNNRSWKTSLKTSMLAGTVILLIGRPTFAQDSVPNPVSMQSNVLQTLGNFMQNFEQQLSSLNQMATPSSQVQTFTNLYSTPSAPARRSASPVKIAPKLPPHAPLPAVASNPLADEEEVGVQQNVDQNISALQSTFNTENSLQAQIGQLSQQKSASNASKIAALTKQLNNEKAFEKQVRSNVDGWNKYLISYEQYLAQNTQPSTPTSDSSSSSSSSDNSVSSSTDNSGEYAPPVDPGMQAILDMQAQLQAQQQADQQAQQQQAQRDAAEQQQQALQDAQAQAQQQADQQAQQQQQQQQAQTTSRPTGRTTTSAIASLVGANVNHSEFCDGLIDITHSPHMVAR